MNYTDKQIEELLKRVYEGSIDPSTDLPEDLYLAIGKHLEKGLYAGYGGNMTDFAFGGTDHELLDTLRNNVYLFSGAKTYQQCREMSQMAANSKNFKEFKEQARKVYDQYNVDWLKAEYNTAIGQATQANQWNDIEADKETFPYLRYVAVMDKNTSEICRPLDGITLPVDHPLWNKYSPLNHFNCRCILEKIDKYEKVKTSSEARVKSVTKELNENVAPEFKMNPGKDGYIFSPKHPYFEVAPKDKDFAKRNFDLPIPPPPIDKIELKNIKEAPGIVKSLFRITQNIPVDSVSVPIVNMRKELSEKLNQLKSLLNEYEIPKFSAYQKTPPKVIFETTKNYYGRVVTSRVGPILEMNFGNTTDHYTERLYDPKSMIIRSKSRVDKDKNLIATTTHEFAHVLGVYENKDIYGMIDSKYSSFWDGIMKNFRAYNKELKATSGLANYNLSLGRYASTNADEFFAEAFTEYKLSSNPSKYAKIVGDLVDKTFKK